MASSLARPPRRRAALSAATVLAATVLAAIAWLVAIEARGASDRGTLVAASYQRDKALPRFDRSRHEVRDGARLRELADVLARHRWQPGDEREDDLGCAGGTRAMLELTYADGSQLRYDGYACGGRGPAVVQAVDALLGRWALASSGDASAPLRPPSPRMPRPA